MYQTPASAVVPLLASGVVDLSGDVWEPCAGGGAILRALVEHGLCGDLLASDISPQRSAWPDGVECVGEDGRHDIIDVPPAKVARHAWPSIRSKIDGMFVTPASTTWRRLTVITNPPYRIPKSDRVCGMRGDLLEAMVPESPPTRVDGVRYRWRDGVAAVFAAAEAAGATQIVLGPIRSSWWMGAKCRQQLRKHILMNYVVRVFSMVERPRFLNAKGVPSKGTDSCDYVWLVADRAGLERPWRPYATQIDLALAEQFAAAADFGGAR